MTRVALVTGGSYGLGFELARVLTSAGYTTIVTGRDASKLDDAVKALSEGQGRASGYVGDVADTDAMAAIAEAVKAKHRRLDLLVNNAGICFTETVDNMSLEQIRRLLDVTLFGQIASTKLFLPLLGEGSRILFIASAGGLVGMAGYAAYNAAKAGVVNFAEALRRELLRRKIAVHVAVPADLDTPGLKAEKQGLPAWAAAPGARGNSLAPEVAARRILAGCRDGRFLVFSDATARLLYLVTKLVPRRTRDRWFDALFPRP